MNWPKHYYFLLVGFGVSGLGNWVYLIALNVYIWHLTHSPTAVALLYIIGPIVKMLCGFFVGSYIDRWNKKKIVIYVDLIRGLLVCMMPFAENIVLAFLLVAMTNIVSAFFGPSSTYLKATHVAPAHLQRFNAINSTLSSGSFMIGPALGGFILMVSTTSMAMWLNGISFILCALCLYFIPNEEKPKNTETEKMSLRMIKEDWQLVYAYSKTIRPFTLFLIAYSIALMITYALDSQEMTFLLSHLQISESLYGVTVTASGIGALAGGVFATLLANKWHATTFVKIGFLLTTICYLAFYLSNAYIVAFSSFVLLGVFMAFSNTGFSTLYQMTIEKEFMGRFGSILDLFQSMLQIIFTIILGVVAQWISIQFSTVLFASAAVIFAGRIVTMRALKEKKQQVVIESKIL